MNVQKMLDAEKLYQEHKALVSGRGCHLAITARGWGLTYGDYTIIDGLQSRDAAQTINDFIKGVK